MQGRLDVNGWSTGTSFSATSGSLTISRILSRMNSDAVSLARRSSTDVDERAEQELEAALVPRRLVDGLALLVAHLQRRSLGQGVRASPPAGVRRPSRRSRRSLALTSSRNALSTVPWRAGMRVLRRALEHGEVAGLLGDHRDRLDAARAGADHADALAGEVDALVGPRAGVVRVALEASTPGDVRASVAIDRQPMAVMTNCAVTVSPWSVSTAQRLAGLVAVGAGRRGSRTGCCGAGRSGRRRGSGSAGSPAARGTCSLHSHSCISSWSKEKQ